MTRRRHATGFFPGLMMLAWLVSFASLAQAGDPAGTQAAILFAKGDVAVRPAGGEWQPARTGQALSAGTEVRVGPQSYVEVAYDRAHTRVSRLDQEGLIKITEAGPDGIRLELQRGRLFNLVAPLASGEHFIVQTPEAVATVRGTAFEGVHTDHTEIKVFDLGDTDPHHVAVQAIDREGRALGEERLVYEGEKASAAEGRVRETEPLSTDEQAGARELLREVEQHAEEAAPTDGATQVPPGTPPPGAPPAVMNPPEAVAMVPQDVGAMIAPAVTKEELSKVMREMPMDVGMPREMPDMPPMDEEHMRAMADVLGVSPEQFQEMSPRDIAERMEGTAVEHLRTEQEVSGRAMDERMKEYLPEFSHERPNEPPEHMMGMERPERMEREYFTPEQREQMEREDFREFHDREMERPDRHEMAAEIRQENRDFNMMQTPPPSADSEPMPPPPSGDQPPNYPPPQ